MHEQNIIYSKTHLDGTTHEQAIMCTSLSPLSCPKSCGVLLANVKEERYIETISFPVDLNL